MVGRRVLAPLIKVRILVPQPAKQKGYGNFLITFFNFVPLQLHAD